MPAGGVTRLPTGKNARKRTRGINERLREFESLAPLIDPNGVVF